MGSHLPGSRPRPSTRLRRPGAERQHVSTTSTRVSVLDAPRVTRCRRCRAPHEEGDVVVTMVEEKDRTEFHVDPVGDVFGGASADDPSDSAPTRGPVLAPRSVHLAHRWRRRGPRHKCEGQPCSVSYLRTEAPDVHGSACECWPAGGSSDPGTPRYVSNPEAWPGVGPRDNTRRETLDGPTHGYVRSYACTSRSEVRGARGFRQ